MVKKGRHRRYEEARAVKRTTTELQLGDVGFTLNASDVDLVDYH